MTTITVPAGYVATDKASHASAVLRYLLTTYPNQTISHEDVVEILGYRVGRTATSNAANRLRRGPFGLNIASRGGPGGGYVLLVPVFALGKESCASCSAYRRGVCRRLKGREVHASDWCAGYRG